MFSHRTAARAASPRNRRARCDGFCRFCEPKDRLAAKFDFTPALRNSFDRHPYPAWTRFSAPLFCVKPLRGAYSVCRRASGFPSIFPHPLSLRPSKALPSHAHPFPRGAPFSARSGILPASCHHPQTSGFHRRASGFPSIFCSFLRPAPSPLQGSSIARTSIPARRAFLRPRRQHAPNRRGFCRRASPLRRAFTLLAPNRRVSRLIVKFTGKSRDMC